MGSRDNGSGYEKKLVELTENPDWEQQTLWM
jgi:hypothetical protein